MMARYATLHSVALAQMYLWYKVKDSICFGYLETELNLTGWLVGWLVLGSTALSDSISVYIRPSPKEREKEKRKDRGE